MQCSLTTEEMNADFGNTYIELKNEYPDWSKNLHENGNILEINDLKKIFCRGLLLWYIKYCLKKTGLNLFGVQEIYTSFYEIKKLIKFFYETNPDILDTKLKNLLKYDSYQSLMLTDRIKPCESFKKYIVRHDLKNNINVLIAEKSKYETLRETICGEKSLENFIYDTMILTHIVKLGTVFQRWKIVLEKMSIASINKDDLYMKNIYLVDKFLTVIQEMILLYVNSYINLLKDAFITNNSEKYKQNKKSFDNFYEYDVYKNIANEIKNSDKLLQKIKSPEILDQNMVELIQSLIML